METQPPIEPRVKRAYVFIDGQNLFRRAKEAFGYFHPNYAIPKLPLAICRSHAWEASAIHFYTGVPEKHVNAMWHGFWESKLLSMSRQGVKTFSRPIRLRQTEVVLPDGTTVQAEAHVEKGVDVRIAIDIIRHAIAGNYDIALIFSQDQDLSEAVDEVKKIAREENRWIRVASAFPENLNLPQGANRGINGTDWIPIPKETYNQNIDPKDYRPRNRTQSLF